MKIAFDLKWFHGTLIEITQIKQSKVIYTVKLQAQQNEAIYPIYTICLKQKPHIWQTNSSTHCFVLDCSSSKCGIHLDTINNSASDNNSILQYPLNIH